MISGGPSDFVKDARRQFDAISTRRILSRWQRAPMADGPRRSPRASKESKSFESARQHAQGFKSRVGPRGQTQSGASDQERNQQTRQESLVQQERQDRRAGGQCPVSQTDQESA